MSNSIQTELETTNIPEEIADKPLETTEEEKVCEYSQVVEKISDDKSNGDRTEQIQENNDSSNGISADIHNIVNNSEKPKKLTYKDKMKEKVVCPETGKLISLHTLKYKRKCKTKNEQQQPMQQQPVNQRQQIQQQQQVIIPDIEEVPQTYQPTPQPLYHSIVGKSLLKLNRTVQARQLPPHLTRLYR